MAVKIASSVITLVLLVGVAVVVLAAMLMIMNGFSESDAALGIGAFGLLALADCIGSVVAAARLAARFAKRDMPPAVAGLLSTMIATVVGSVLVGMGGLVGVVIAEIVRRNH
jgi:hypothetical protein